MLKKRAYEPKEYDDAERILVDRLWPRGISKEKAAINVWAKELAPSTELREWLGHEPVKWEEFKKRYIEELSSPEKTSLLRNIAQRTKTGTITLIYSAGDTEHSDVQVLKELINQLIKQSSA